MSNSLAQPLRLRFAFLPTRKTGDASSGSRVLTCWTLLLAMVAVGSVCQANSPGMLEFVSAGQTQRGVALVDVNHELVVLDRQGKIHWLGERERRTIKKIDETYRPATVMEMKSRLQAEFGKSFEVVTTQNFLVVQPRGRGQRWPNTFEKSHRAFISYMSRRGVKIRRGRFPMIAIVFPDSPAMYAEFKKQSIDMPRVAGLYSSDSNRVMTHDGGHDASIASTVRHEAAHQSAFNFGVHSRVVNHAQVDHRRHRTNV